MSGHHADHRGAGARATHPTPHSRSIPVMTQPIFSVSLNKWVMEEASTRESCGRRWVTNATLLAPRTPTDVNPDVLTALNAYSEGWEWG